MEATELMIGDYVTFRDSQKYENPDVVKIWQINGDGDALASIDGETALDEIAIDEEIVGYSLTPEIFEKNGWKISWVDGFPMYATMKDEEIGLSYEYYFHEARLRQYSHFYGKRSLTAQFPGAMNYVHELQHGLRLCGCTKQIIL